MGHEWTKKAVEQPMYSMRDMEVAEKKARAEVLANAVTLLEQEIHAESLVCHKTSGMELLQGIRKSLLNLQPAAEALKELLRKERIRELDNITENAPGYSTDVMDFVEARYKELEKAHTVLKGKK